MKKYGIIGIVFVGVAVICAFTFRGHKEADYLLTDFPAEADPVTVGNKIADRFLEQWHSQYGSPLRVDEPRTQSLIRMYALGWVDCGSTQANKKQRLGGTLGSALPTSLHDRGLSATASQSCG